MNLRHQARLAAKMLRKGRKLAEQFRKVNSYGKEEYLPMKDAVEDCTKTASAVFSLLRK